MKNIACKLMIALFVVVICSHLNISVYAENNDFSLKELKGKTSFNCFIPTDIPKYWNVELKYPEQVHANMKEIQIHFFNKAGTQLELTVNEKSAANTIVEPYEHEERVKIKNMNGVFHPITPTKRIKDVQGGQLIWVQDGTMITLFSLRISKQELMKIAQSMQKL
ncbi:DUF4367 domain-containing protein [Microbacteriaceae bacterium 4G12]